MLYQLSYRGMSVPKDDGFEDNITAKAERLKTEANSDAKRLVG